jgi:hypothetical protein
MTEAIETTLLGEKYTPRLRADSPIFTPKNEWESKISKNEHTVYEMLHLYFLDNDRRDLLDKVVEKTKRTSVKSLIATIKNGGASLFEPSETNLLDISSQYAKIILASAKYDKTLGDFLLNVYPKSSKWFFFDSGILDRLAMLVVEFLEETKTNPTNLLDGQSRILLDFVDRQLNKPSVVRVSIRSNQFGKLLAMTTGTCIPNGPTVLVFLYEQIIGDEMIYKVFAGIHDDNGFTVIGFPKFRAKNYRLFYMNGDIGFVITKSDDSTLFYDAKQRGNTICVTGPAKPIFPDGDCPIAICKGTFYGKICSKIIARDDFYYKRSWIVDQYEPIENYALVYTDGLYALYKHKLSNKYIFHNNINKKRTKAFSMEQDVIGMLSYNFNMFLFTETKIHEFEGKMPFY